MNFGNQYEPGEKAVCGVGLVGQPRTQKQQLQDQRAAHASQIEKLDEAIALLDKYPDVERLLTLMRSL